MFVTFRRFLLLFVLASALLPTIAQSQGTVPTRNSAISVAVAPGAPDKVLAGTLNAPEDVYKRQRVIKWGSIVASFLPLGLSIYLMAAYDWGTGGMQFELSKVWIESLNANFHLGVDGLSVPLIFLTALLSTLCFIYSAGTIRTRVKEYFILLHLLELSMVGVFMALDYVVFYLFWEVSLVPMYLLIGIGAVRVATTLRSNSLSIPWSVRLPCCWRFWPLTLPLEPLTLSNLLHSSPIWMLQMLEIVI